MKKFYQVFIPAFIAISTIVILGLWNTGKLTNLLGDNSSPNAPQIVWSLALNNISKAWRGHIDLSDNHIRSNCSDYYLEKDDIPRELKSCRLELLKCALEGREEKVKVRKSYYSYKTKVHLDKTPRVELSFLKQKKVFELGPTCREVLLPQGLYWGDRKRKKSLRVWNTSGINYWIDRFLVRNIDLKEVLERSGDKGLERVSELVSSLKGEALFSPAGKLFPSEMKTFCERRGAQVLSSRVKAALTFHHGRKNLEDIKSEAPGWNTNDVPFGPRKEDSPSYRVGNGASFEKKMCKKLYSRECKEELYINYFPSALGWNGVAELLGGLPEYVENSEYPRKNIHPSSMYYSLKSKVHKAGLRVFWNGRGNRRIDFNFSTVGPFEMKEDFFEVGFRCMRLVYDEVEQ